MRIVGFHISHIEQGLFTDDDDMSLVTLHLVLLLVVIGYFFNR